MSLFTVLVLCIYIAKVHCLTFVALNTLSIVEPLLGMSLFCFLFHPGYFLSGNSFFLPIMLNILLQVVIFCSKFNYIASYVIVTSYTYIPKLHTNIIVSYSYTDSKCQLLTRPNVLIVLLEYIDFFNPSDKLKQSFGRGCPALYHSILLYFILSMAIVAK